MKRFRYCYSLNKSLIIFYKMLLKRKQGKARSQPKLEQIPVKGMRSTGSSSWSALKRPKHTTTQSSLVQPVIRNHKQRRSLQDITAHTRFNRPQRKKIPDFWLNQFTFEMEIGQGAFGEVWKVRDNKGRFKALKVMHKTKIIAKNSRGLVMNERNIVAQLQHNPFIVNCLEASQDELHLYLLMEYMSGGDLRYLMYRFRRRFTEGQAKFLVGCMLVALEHLHQHGVVHRDVKPENLVIDSKGYMRITDMGISKSINSKVENDSSGTPAYMAPEVFESGQLAFTMDYYAVGVVAFQLLNGKRPYESKTRQGILDEIKQGKELHFNQNLSYEAINFTRSLLIKDPNKRLGTRGIQEIYDHRWFSGVDWNQFKKKKYTSPFKNDLCDAASLQQYNQKLQNGPDLDSGYLCYLTQDLFKGYDYKPIK